MPARPCRTCAAVADVGDGYGGDRIDGVVATMLIQGTCRTEEEAFVRLLGHANWRVRRAAATQIGRLASLGDDTRLALLRSLEDRNEYVKETAAESLLKHELEREACHRALLHAAPEYGASAIWRGVQVMWNYELDPTEAIPLLEAEIAKESTPSIRKDLEKMIDRIRRNDPFVEPAQRRRR